MPDPLLPLSVGEDIRDISNLSSPSVGVDLLGSSSGGSLPPVCVHASLSLSYLSAPCSLAGDY